MAQGDLTKQEGRLHTAATSPRRSRSARYGRTEWAWQVQTSTLAYTDVFFIVGLLSLVITVAALFMSNVTPGAGAGGGD